MGNTAGRGEGEKSSRTLKREGTDASNHNQMKQEQQQIGQGEAQTKPVLLEQQPIKKKTAADIELAANDWLKKKDQGSKGSLSSRTLRSWRTLGSASSRGLLQGASVSSRSRKPLMNQEEDDNRELLGREQTVLANPCFVSEDGERNISKAEARAVFVEALGKSRLLKGTSEELREEIFRNAVVPVFVNEGDVLFEQGSAGHLLFVLVSGKFEATLTGWGGRRKRRKMQTGQAVAEQCVLMNSPHEYTLTAVSDGMILAVHRLQYQMTTVFFADRARAHHAKELGARGEGSSSNDDDLLVVSDINLVNIPIFAFLSKQQMDQIRKAMIELKFRSKERLVASRQAVPGLYIIKSGQVALRAAKVRNPSDDQSKGRRNQFGNASMGSMDNTAGGNGKTKSSLRQMQIEAQQLFAEAEHDEMEWLTRGDYFGEAALLETDGSAQLGVDVFCSSDKGVSILLLKTQDWKRILGDSLGAMLETLRFAHVHRLFNKSPVFSNLAETQIEQLCRHVEFRTFQAGERIVEGGNVVTKEGGMYLLTQGAVRLVPFHGLKPSRSFVEIEKRAQMLRDNSRSVLAGRAGVSSTSPVPLGAPQQQGEGGLSAQKASVRIMTLEKGGSFTGLSPRFFGKQMSLSVHSLLAAENLIGGQEDTNLIAATAAAAAAGGDGDGSVLTTSIDHEALFASLGIADRDYVVLLAGELFGEDGIRTMEKERTAKSTVYAIGKVTVAYISLPVLVKLGIDDVVRNAAFDDILADQRGGFMSFDEGASPGTPTVGGAKGTQDKDVIQRLENSRQIARAFLNDEKMKTEELRMQHKSVRNRRESTTFRMTAKRLFEIKQLHKTPVVNVCLTIHDPSYQILVVKELDVAQANKQEMGSYVLSEQVVLAQINSSHFIANMISSWEEPEKLYLGLEPGLCGDLGVLLQKTLQSPQGGDACPRRGELGGFEFPVVQFIAVCGVLALKHLFEHRIIHRDIKTHNIVMDEFGYCKLVDFGIAKRLPSGTSRTYSLCGSPKYMAPEQVALAFRASGDPYTNAVDWWAFGVTLYELATAKLPYWSSPTDEKLNTNRKMTDKQKNEDALVRVDGYRSEVAQASRAAVKLHSDYDLFENHWWFQPFRSSSKSSSEWKDLGEFLAKLLHPDSDARLGSSTTKRGPREAMDQPVFSSSTQRPPIQFEKVLNKSQVAPFIPKRFIVDLKEAETKQREGKLSPLTSHATTTTNNPTNASGAMKESSSQTRQRPGLKRSTMTAVGNTAAAATAMSSTPTSATATTSTSTSNNIESRVRANLEHPDMDNAKMNEAIQSTDQARKQMIMAREQHIRRIAFKQGRALDELDSVPGSGRNNLKLVVLQRAAVLETLQMFVETGGSTRARRIIAATHIQTYWRGFNARRLATMRIRAVQTIHKFIRRAKGGLSKKKDGEEEDEEKDVRARSSVSTNNERSAHGTETDQNSVKDLTTKASME